MLRLYTDVSESLVGSVLYSLKSGSTSCEEEAFVQSANFFYYIAVKHTFIEINTFQANRSFRSFGNLPKFVNFFFTALYSCQLVFTALQLSRRVFSRP